MHFVLCRERIQMRVEDTRAKSTEVPGNVYSIFGQNFCNEF
jgi:hypothetical protein